MTGDEMRQFDYEFTVNIDSYEATTKFGLTTDETIYVMGAFAVPFLTMQSLVGLVLGVIAGGLTMLFLRKIDRFCGMSLPVYVYHRIGLMMRSGTVEVNQIVPRIDAKIRRVSLDGREIGTYQ